MRLSLIQIKCFLTSYLLMINRVKLLLLSNRKSCMASFDWHIYIWPWLILKVKVQVMHISTGNILKMVIGGENNYCHQIVSHVWCFSRHIHIWHWSILKVRIEAMHILTMNILEMMRDKIQIQVPSNSKSCIGLRLAYLYFNLTHSKGHDQG